MNSIFEKYSKLAREAELQNGTLRSKEWFRKLVSNQPDISSIDKVTKNLPVVTKIKTGQLITFQYDAKLKEVLPYWDRYPLVLVTSITEDGWRGINFHYLHPRMRARILFDQQKRDVPIIENEIAKMSEKRYLANRISRRPRLIEEDLWELAIQLPFENFQKAAKQIVWNKTSKKVNR